MGRFAEIISNLKVGRPGAVLAPMAGITDRPMRDAATKFGATYVVSEMIDARFLNGVDAKAARGATDCLMVQIAGCAPEPLAAIARVAADQGADAIDINMGCPAKKVTGGFAGSALMRDLDEAARLIAAVKAAVEIPVTVKMRLGWDTNMVAPALARRAEEEGVALVAVHGRTRAQFYTGKADWAAIRAVVEAVSIPVVANGDCCGAADAAAMMSDSGAAAVMIGRGALGRPWIVGQIAHLLETGRQRPAPTPAEQEECAQAHYQGLLDLHGRERGIRHARKHLAAYATHCGYAPASRPHADLVTATEPADVVRGLRSIFRSAPCGLAA